MFKKLPVLPWRVPIIQPARMSGPLQILFFPFFSYPLTQVCQSGRLLPLSKTADVLHAPI
jgi:hypothetical protein